MREDRGFSLIEVLAIVSIIGVIAAIATPAFMNMAESMRLGQSARELERELQDGRLKAVATNRRIRVRTNCPVTGQYRIVQVLGTAADPPASRCSETTYPYNASNQNPVTKIQDGAVKRLSQGTTVGTFSIEFRGDGSAYSVDGTGSAMTITTPLTLTLTRNGKTKGISVNALGKVQLLQ